MAPGVRWPLLARRVGADLVACGAILAIGRLVGAARVAVGVGNRRVQALGRVCWASQARSVLHGVPSPAGEVRLGTAHVGQGGHHVELGGRRRGGLGLERCICDGGGGHRW